METTRQQKIAKQIQKDVAEIFQKEGAGIVRRALVTVTAVRISPDFGYAKVYVSIFPFDRSAATMKEIEHQNWFIRRALGQRIRNQVRMCPSCSSSSTTRSNTSSISKRRSSTTSPNSSRFPTPCCRSFSPAATFSRPNPVRSST